jgi:hypothetical protein
MDPLAIPVDIDVKVKAPLYGLVLTERLNSQAVRVTFDWLCEVFSERNPWLRDEVSASVQPNSFDENFRRLFNVAASRE